MVAIAIIGMTVVEISLSVVCMTRVGMSMSASICAVVAVDINHSEYYTLLYLKSGFWETCWYEIAP